MRLQFQTVAVCNGSATDVEDAPSEQVSRQAGEPGPGASKILRTQFNQFKKK